MLDAARFLALLFAAIQPHEYIEVRPIRGRTAGPRRWFALPTAAAIYALSLSGRWDTYVGVNPRCDGGGKKDDVTSVGLLHSDLDDKRYPDGRAGVLAALAGFPLPPSLLVDSGGGVQAYWLLLARLAAAEAGARVEGLLTRLYARLGGVDSVQDVSRVLRIPQSVNLKYVPPRPVMVLSCHPERRYTLDQFEELLPAPPSPPRRPPWSPSSGRVRPDVPSPAEIREMLRYVPPRGDYKVDWLRVLAAIHSAYPGPEGVALAEEWSPGYPGEIERKFRSFGRYRGENGPATIGTLIHLARRHGWRPANTAPPAFEYRRGQVVR